MSPIPYARIATELRDPKKILARIQAQGQASANGAAYAPPRTELERRLAEIWAEALRVSPWASTTISSISAAIRCWRCS